MLTNDDMRNILRHRVEAAGGASQWCRENGGIDPAYVSIMLSGKAPVGGNVMRALGYEKKIHFVALHTANKVQ